MSKISEAIDELQAQEAAFVILVMHKPEDEDDELELQIETNLRTVPSVFEMMLQGAANAILGEDEVGEPVE